MPGTLAALSAALSWAIASIQISRLLEHGRVTPAAANLFKNGLAATFFFVASLVLGGAWPVGTAWGWLFVSGLLGFAIADTLYFAAFRRCGVQTAATVLLLNVPVASLLAVPIVGDRLDSAVLPHAAIVLIGVILVILDGPAKRTSGDGASAEPPTRFASGILLALLAAFAIGLALPLGRHRFDDVGVWPGAFIRLAGGAFGAIPLAALGGLRRGTTPSAEVASLVEPLFRVPGPSSVWGRTALTGVGVAILGLIPYHYALRELPSGIASILFATTPLFTLPLSLLVRQRIGIAAVLGSAIGFTGVAGVLLVENAASVEEPPLERSLLDVTLDVIPLSIDAPEGAQFPTFVVGGARPDPVEGAPILPPMLALEDSSVLAPDDGESAGVEEGGASRLLLLGFQESAGPGIQSVLEELGPGSAADRLHVHFANLPRAARLSSGGLVFTHPEELPGDGASPLDVGIKLSLADGGPPLRGIGWLSSAPEPPIHGFTTLVSQGAAASAVAVWLDERLRSPRPPETGAAGLDSPDTGAEAPGADVQGSSGEAGSPPSGSPSSGSPALGRGGAVRAPIPGSGNTQLRARIISPSGDLGPEQVVDGRVARSCPSDGVRLADGTVLIAYRNLGTGDEVDISIARRSPQGMWAAPSRVHADGWRFNGPLVNGPAIAADGTLVAVAWYVQLDGVEPAVRVAFSGDGGVSFGPPQTLFEGETRGQVQLAALGAGLFVLTHEAPPPDAGEPGQPGSWQAVVVARGARSTEPVRVGALLGRSSGRLDLIEGPPGIAFAAWTGPTGLEAARITAEQERSSARVGATESPAPTVGDSGNRAETPR